MLSEALLEQLCCPEDHTRLTRAEPALVAAVNERIRARRTRNRAGRTVEQTLDEGLVRKNRDLLYPVVDGIPRLLVDEGIPLVPFELSDLEDRIAEDRP